MTNAEINRALHIMEGKPLALHPFGYIKIPNYLADGNYILGLQIRYKIEIAWGAFEHNKNQVTIGYWDGMERSVVGEQINNPTMEQVRRAVALAAIAKEKEGGQ